MWFDLISLDQDLPEREIGTAIVKNFGSQDFKDYLYEVEHGGRFVIFHYTISVIFFSFQQTTPIFLIRGSQSWFIRSLPYTLITLLLGWWGFPAGPVYTIQSLYANLRGGEDVTEEVLESAKVRLDPRSQYF